MWTRWLIIGSAVWMIAGCATPAPLPVTPIPRPAPVTLMQSCPALPLPGETMGELLIAYVETAGLYHQCAARVAAWIEWTEAAQDE